MSFLSPDDLDLLIHALLMRDPLSEDECRALILELASHRAGARSVDQTTRGSVCSDQKPLCRHSAIRRS